MRRYAAGLGVDVSLLLDAIKRQEAALALPAFDKAIAWEIGGIARQLAMDRGHAVAIEVRSLGVPVFASALEGTSPNSMRWLTRKGNTVMLFDRSSYGVALHMTAKGQTLARHALPDADYAADGGGFPLRVTHAGLVGSLTVSGLDQRSDHELAVEVHCLHLGVSYKELKLPA